MVCDRYMTMLIVSHTPHFTRCAYIISYFYLKNDRGHRLRRDLAVDYINISTTHPCKWDYLYRFGGKQNTHESKVTLPESLLSYHAILLTRGLVAS